MNRIPALDGLRGWAVLFVLWGHFPFLTAAPEVKHIAMSVGSGGLGVTVFFVLSGFLITRILLREKLDGSFSFGTFYLKRSLRIFPIYYLVLLVTGLFITSRHMGWLAVYTGNFLFAFDPSPHPLRHTWSLAVEEHFYLVWPFMVGSLALPWSRRMIRWVLPGLALVCALATPYMLPLPLAEGLIYRGTMYQILALCLGAAIAYDEKRACQLPGWIVHVLLLFGAALVFFGSRSTNHWFGPLLISAYTLKLVYYSAASLCVVLAALNVDRGRGGPLLGVVAFALKNPVLRFVGMISYGIYLYHYPILYSLGLMRDGVFLSSGESIALTALLFAVPVISWYAIEAPLLRWKEHLVRNRVRPSSVA